MGDALEIYRTIAAFAIPIGALWYAARSFFLKKGIHIRGSYTIASSISCDDRYVRHVTLYNLKDRAVPIFKLLLSVGHGYYIEVDNFEDNPLILRPFETWHHEYDPIDMYTTNLSRVDVNDVLQNGQARHRLVLSTGEGKYVVKKWIKRWDPMFDWVRNYSTVVIHPRRSLFEGKAYGSNAKYIIELTLANDRKEVVPIFPGDHSIRKFRHFQLTFAALSSKEALEEFLLERAVDGDIKCKDIRVHDLDAWRGEMYERMTDRFTLSERSWIEYAVLGRAATWYSNAKLRRKSRDHQRKRLTEAHQTKSRPPRD